MPHATTTPSTTPDILPVMVATPGGRYPRRGGGELGLSLIRLQLAELMQAVVFTEEEQNRALGNIYGCEDARRLQRWFRNVSRVKQEREAAGQGTLRAVTADALAADDAAAQAEGAAALNLALQALTLPATDAAVPANATVLGQTLRRREQRGRTSDYAAEQLAWQAHSEFLSETGLTWSEVARL